MTRAASAGDLSAPVCWSAAFSSHSACQPAEAARHMQNRIRGIAWPPVICSPASPNPPPFAFPSPLSLYYCCFFSSPNSFLSQGLCTCSLSAWSSFLPRLVWPFYLSILPPILLHSLPFSPFLYIIRHFLKSLCLHAPPLRCKLLVWPILGAW